MILLETPMVKTVCVCDVRGNKVIVLVWDVKRGVVCRRGEGYVA